MSQLRAVLTVLTVITAQTVLAQPSTVELSGVVRDFKRAHPDFDVMPIGGPGHYAGNVDIAISPSDHPVFAGGGFKVATQWQMASFHPIAPHMYNEGGGGDTVALINGPVIEDNPTLDTFDSSLPYDEDTAGPAPGFVTGVTMPSVTVAHGSALDRRGDVRGQRHEHAEQ